MKICSVDGCEAAARSWGFCHKHRMRWWRHGDPLVVMSSARAADLSGSSHPRWVGEDVTYGRMHGRLSTARGKASDHTCACGSRAEEWSYDHLDPNEKTGRHNGSTVVFSVDPDHYSPLCRPCHRSLDAPSTDF